MISLLKASSLTWLGSVIIFAVTIAYFVLYVNKDISQPLPENFFNTFLIVTLLAGVAVGSLAFCISFLTLLNKLLVLRKKDAEVIKRTSHVKVRTLVAGIIIIAVFTLTGTIFADRNHFLGNSLFRSSPQVFSEQPLSTLQSESPSIIKQKTESDPIISCKFEHSGVVNLKQSQCASTYTDCGFLNGSWKVMPKNEYLKQQAAEQPNKNPPISSQNSTQLVSVVCITSAKTYTQYGRTYDEAWSLCRQVQDIYSNMAKDAKGNEDLLNQMKAGADAIANKTYTSDFSPPTITTPSPPPNIPDPTPAACILTNKGWICPN